MRGGSVRRARGFILTLELLLLVSIFSVVVIFGLALLQRHFVQSTADAFGRTIFVYDSTLPLGNSRLIGKAVGFNQYESPLVVYRIPDPSAPLAVLLGVRPNHFTTRQSVFYDSPGCSGGTWMLDPANPLAGVAGEASELYALQGAAFAIGTNGGSANVLFRSTSGAAPLTTPQSRWVSERHDTPCQPVADDPALRAALVPAPAVSDMSTIYAPPYWVPAQTTGPLPTPPAKEGDPWL
jgi:hypothetical protein